VALKQAQSKEFKEYQKTVLRTQKPSPNGSETPPTRAAWDTTSSAVGTDNHLVLVDLKSKDIDGARVERVLELCGLAANKNTVPGDKSALKPEGLRMGSPAMTTAGSSLRISRASPKSWTVP